ncbi:MAG: STAS/SEC14 domain-containing protein [Paracoccaceae bacterium]
MLTTDAIRQIPASDERVYAFRIEGGVGTDEMADLARTMNEAFDRHDEPIRMLLILHDFGGPGDAVAGFSLEGLRAQFRSPARVGRYAVVGAPEIARRMIEANDKIAPIDARTFDPGEEDAAWAFVEARPAT